jgi:hypothetical protein
MQHNPKGSQIEL